MSKEKFTQGDWSVADGTKVGEQVLFVHVADKGVVCRLTKQVDTHLPITEFDLADAHLIAAAPDMYRKLKDLSKLMAMLDPYTPDLMELDCVTSEIDGLLAKARGE